MRSLLLALLAATACGPPAAPASPPGNRVTPGVAITIAATEPLGWLGLGLERTRDAHPWLPASAQFGAMTLTDDTLPPKLTVIGVSGPAQILTVGAPVSLKYGCDDNSLGVQPLTGPRLPPGPAWLLPPTAPKTWTPAALEVRSTQADLAHHSYVAGPLTFELVRTSNTSGHLQIFREGNLVHDLPFERSEMDGADPAPIDLDKGGPGVPAPIAAWSVAPAGPFLVVLLRPGYEGVTLQPLLVEASRARVLEDLTMYLYACAF